MNKQGVMTTSWDDGHPLDFRVAELLTKHGLAGTFYVPKRWRLPTMSDVELKQLHDVGFELGGHTIDHLVLTEITTQKASEEIHASKAWLEDVSQAPCKMFCPPCGKFKAAHIEIIRDAGYAGFRTVEGWSLDRPRNRGGGLLEMPTTIQAQPHVATDHLRNIGKRRSLSNLITFAKHGQGDWVTQMHKALKSACKANAVFQLWGHSWEIEEANQWDELNNAFEIMSRYLDRMLCKTNGQIVADASV